MRYITARQAWHDAYYTGKPNTIDQYLTLGVTIQKTEINNSTQSCMDAWLKGRVQNVIAKMSAPFRSFGNFMYSPMANIDDLETAQEAIFTHFMMNYKGQKLSDKKGEQIEVLCIAALFDYKFIVFGNPSPFKSKSQMCKWLDEEKGVFIDSVNWVRDWGSIFNSLLDACGHMDKVSLEPVSRIISIKYNDVA